ncbi:MAG: hypothetical protein FWF99_00665 [Desulfovibrionaceae bacterium]|nr:hypothetical protein [Desulfovibrionaceae bacterium]
MRELSELHSCATCMHSGPPPLDRASSFEGHGQRPGLPGFLREEALRCALIPDLPGGSPVLEMLVRHEGRCASYDCHPRRFRKLHSCLPEDEEAGIGGRK